jgi:hypothetical protein
MNATHGRFPTMDADEPKTDDWIYTTCGFRVRSGDKVCFFNDNRRRGS